MKFKIAKLVFHVIGFCPTFVPSNLKIGWYLWPLGPYNKEGFWSYVEQLIHQSFFQQKLRIIVIGNASNSKGGV